MSDKKKPEASSVQCKKHGCKHSPSKFGFCADHFDQFKFGLINKGGEPCMDYDKKLDQYEHARGRKVV